MVKLVLNDVTNLNALSVINDNFDKLEDEINDKVLYRDNPVGEDNTIQSDLDMNGNRLYNLPEPSSPSEAVRLQDLQDAVLGGGVGTIPSASSIAVTPFGSISSTNVQSALQEIVAEAGSAVAGVSTFNTRNGAVVLNSLDVTQALGYTPVGSISPAFTGFPTTTTATSGDNSARIASTAFVQAAIAGSVAGVASFNTRTGAVSLTASDVSSALGFSPASTASPTFTGNVTVPLQPNGAANNYAASTQWVQNQLGLIGTFAVSSWNGRTGAVTMNSTDVSSAMSSGLFSASKTTSVDWIDNDPNGSYASTAANSFVLYRNAAYSGGGVDYYGNRKIGRALSVVTTTSTNHTNAEYCFSALCNSFANRDPAAVTIGQSWPQNVGAFLGAFQRGTATVFGANIVALDFTGTDRNPANNKEPIIGMEVNVGMIGTDPGRGSIGAAFVPQSVNGTTASCWAAVWASGGSTTTWQNSFVASTGTNASFLSEATGTWGIRLAGNYVVGIDTSSAAISGSALRIANGQSIDFDGSSVYKLSHGSGGLSYTVGGVAKNVLGDNGDFTFVGKLVTQSSGNVTNNASGYSPGVLPPSAAGFLIIVIDGSSFKVPFFNY